MGSKSTKPCSSRGKFCGLARSRCGWRARKALLLRQRSDEEGGSADHTRVIPQGVKLNELEGTRNVDFSGKSGFEKKSNKGTKIFVIGAMSSVCCWLVCCSSWFLTNRTLALRGARPSVIPPRASS